MRYLITLFSLSLFIVSCSSNTQNTTISGTIHGFKKGTLYLQQIQDTAFVAIDSILINGSSDFAFHLDLAEPELLLLLAEPKDASLIDDQILFFAEKGTVTIETDLDKFGSKARINGSANDSILRIYNKLKQRFVSRNLELIEEQLKLKSGSSDSAALAITNKQQRLKHTQQAATINFVLNHKTYEVAPYLALVEAPFANIKFLDTVYHSLAPKIKDSKYATELESWIQFRKENDSL